MQALTASHDYRGTQMKVAHISDAPARDLDAEARKIAAGLEVISLHCRVGDRFRLKKAMAWNGVMIREGAEVFVLHKIPGGSFALHIINYPEKAIALETQRGGEYNWTIRPDGFTSDVWERMHDDGMVDLVDGVPVQAEEGVPVYLRAKLRGKPKFPSYTPEVVPAYWDGRELHLFGGVDVGKVVATGAWVGDAYSFQ